MPELNVALELSTLGGASSGRGLGRYTNSCREACGRLGLSVTPIEIHSGSGRLSELFEVAQRTAALKRSPHHVFHATHPHVWGFSRQPTVVTVHDVVQFDVAAYRRSGLKARAFYAAVQHADHIVCVSDFTSGRLQDLYPRTAGKISVVPSPPSPFFVNAGRLEVDFRSDVVFTLVDMATPDPRKRASWLAPLADKLRERGIRLVVAGAGSDLPAAKAELGCAEGLGRVDDARLTQLLQTSACFVYLSAYEGQGLPPLEAMAAGLPVVAMDNSAVTEVVGEGGFLIAEQSKDWDDAVEGRDADRTLEHVADACGSLCSDRGLRSTRRAAAIEQSRRFTDARFDEGIGAAYAAAVDRRKRT